MQAPSVDGRADPAQAGYMTGDPCPSPFELAAAELRPLGIALARLPGEYRVNFRNAGDTSVRTAETLDEALELGRSIRQHNRRMRARAIRQQLAVEILTTE